MTNNSGAIAERLQHHPDVIAKGLARAFSRTGNKDGVSIQFHSPEIENLLKDAFNDTTLAATPSNIPVEQALNTLTDTIQRDTETSLNEATPAGASEIGAALAPHLNRPPALASVSPSETVTTPGAGTATHQPPFSPITMPGEGSGEDSQPASNQPLDLGPISDTPGTPDDELGYPPIPSQTAGTTPGNGAQNRPGSTPTSVKATSPDQPNFSYHADAPKRDAELPGFAQETLTNQLTSPSSQPTGATSLAPETTTTAPGSSPTASTAGSGLPGVSVPQATPGANITPAAASQSGATPTAQADTEAAPETVSILQRMQRRMQLRTAVKKLDTQIAELDKHNKQLTFRSFWLCLAASFMKDVAILLGGIGTATIILPLMCGIFGAICGATIAVLLWLEHAKFKKEVLAPVKVLFVALGAIPFFNTAMVYKMENKSRKLRKRSLQEIHKLQQQRHKLMTARQV